MTDIYAFLNKNLYAAQPSSQGSMTVPAGNSITGYGETASETIVSGEIHGDLSFIGGFIQSKNFVSGTTGWRLSSDGTLEAVDATLSGTITATAGTIGGTTISASALTGGVFQTASSGARVVIDGASNVMEVYTATYRGIRISNSLINIYDTDGTTVVTSINGPGITTDNLVIDLLVSLNGFVLSDWVPNNDVTYDLGSTTKKWDNAWCDELHYNTLTAISDERTKERIEPMGRKIDSLLKLEPKKYRRKETGKIEYGLVAQDVLAVFPEAVREHRDDNGDTTLGIDMGVIITTAVQSIQELSAEVDNLKRQLASK